jgi:hypothetical protein
VDVYNVLVDPSGNFLFVLNVGAGTTGTVYSTGSHPLFIVFYNAP